MNAMDGLFRDAGSAWSAIMRRAIRVAAVLTLVAASAVVAETMYARTSAVVRADKGLSAPVVAELNQGDAVDVLEKDGFHYRVSAVGKEGWLYYNKLAEQKPEDVAALLGADPARPIELAEMEAGGALRGLSPLAEEYAKRAKNIPKWAARAVDQMQGLKITRKDLEAFAREGRLGEYGEGQ